MSQNELAQTIKDSERMLEWEDDFDGEGSPAYSPKAWSRGVRFATFLYDNGWRGFDIDPGPDGSIDIDIYPSALFNVPEDMSEPITFYVESEGFEINGTFVTVVDVGASSSGEEN